MPAKSKPSLSAKLKVKAKAAMKMLGKGEKAFKEGNKSLVEGNKMAPKAARGAIAKPAAAAKTSIPKNAGKAKQADQQKHHGKEASRKNATEGKAQVITNHDVKPGKQQDFKKTVGQARTAIEKAGSAGAAARKAAGGAICREVACELMSTTGGYCRMHYIKNWKKIKRKELILKEKKLNHYIEELVSKYPDKYIEAIRQDLASEKDFAKVIADLEVDESLEDFEVAEGGPEVEENIIDNLKRDFDDDGDVF